MQKRDEDEQVGYSTCVWRDGVEARFYFMCVVGLTGMVGFGHGEFWAWWVLGVARCIYI